MYRGGEEKSGLAFAEQKWENNVGSDLKKRSHMRNVILYVLIFSDLVYIHSKKSYSLNLFIRSSNITL